MIERGKLISFEGCEACGKSTQAILLADHLAARGLEVVLTREPGGTEGAEGVRTLLMAREWSPASEFLLFLAARLDHLETLIEPALARGAWVICDRYVDSSFVYQGIVRGFGFGKAVSLHNMVIGGSDYYPNATILLHLPVAESMQRIKARGSSNRFDQYPIEFHARLYEAYKKLPGYFTTRFLEYDATASVESLAENILANVLTKFYGKESNWPSSASTR